LILTSRNIASSPLILLFVDETLWTKGFWVLGLSDQRKQLEKPEASLEPV
jgi:hypothetical protein